MRIIATTITSILTAFITYEIYLVMTEHQFIIAFVGGALALMLNFIINTDRI